MMTALLLAALGAVPVPLSPMPPAEITVTGDAEMKFVPNQAVVQMVIQNTDKDLNAAKRTNDDHARKLIAALLNAGVEGKHIQTQAAQVAPQYKYYDNESRLTGYAATKTFAVCITDLSRLDEATTAALRAGVT